MAKSTRTKKSFVPPPTEWIDASQLTSGRFIIWSQPNIIEDLPAGAFIAEVFQFGDEWRYLAEGQNTGCLGQCDCIEGDWRFIRLEN